MSNLSCYLLSQAVFLDFDPQNISTQQWTTWTVSCFLAALVNKDFFLTIHSMWHNDKTIFHV